MQSTMRWDRVLAIDRGERNHGIVNFFILHSYFAPFRYFVLCFSLFFFFNKNLSIKIIHLFVRMIDKNCTHLRETFDKLRKPDELRSGRIRFR